MQAIEDLKASLFAQALQALLTLAQTTDKDHIKLRALLEIARLCRPAPSSPPNRTPSASDGPQAHLAHQRPASPQRPGLVARAPGSDDPKPTTLNRRQRRALARVQANARKRAPVPPLATLSP